MNKRHKPEIVTGAYGDRAVNDEWLWAACELYTITKDGKYLTVISNRIIGVGSKTPMDPHHCQSEADGIIEPVPGLLVGGPNIGMQDNCNYTLREAETAYVDDVCSYA